MTSELACAYAALLLVDDDIAVTSEKIATILKAAKIETEPYWPTLFGKALESVNIKQLVSNIGSGVGAAPAAAPSADAGGKSGGGEEKKEAKKEEKEEESDDDMGFGLFD